MENFISDIFVGEGFPNGALLPPAGWNLRRITGFLFSAFTGAAKEGKEREAKFRSVIESYGNIISGICFSYAVDADDLKDLRQDIMINIWKGLQTFRGDSSLSTWIYRVALNTCVSTIRNRSRRPSVVALEPSIDAVYEDDSETRERIETLHALISTLSPLDKAVITMWLDDRHYEEIGEVVGISRNNVAVRINRIRHRLTTQFMTNLNS